MEASASSTPALDTSSESAPERDGLLSVVHAFFHTQHDMQRAISIFCGAVQQQSSDIITPTILMMLNTTLQMQLTAVGWQPFRSRDLTYPYHAMNQVQKEAILSLFGAEHEDKWTVFDHAMVYKRGQQPVQLKPLDVLGALCSLVLASDTYTDKRLRLAVCNILLQRVQASMALDKYTQMALNQRLFPRSSANPSNAASPSCPATKMIENGAISPMPDSSAHISPLAQGALSEVERR
jgi:hypothetical protein